MKKRLVTLMLIVSMAASMLVGCGQKPAADDKDGEGSAYSGISAVVQQTSQEREENSNFNEEGYPIVDEKITLKVMLAIRDTDNIVDPEEIPALQRLEELTNIDLEWEVIKATNWSTELNLMFASGDYPDIILSTHCTVDYEEYGVNQQILIPLDELIEKYLPSYTERIAMEELDPTRNLIASDGKQYAVGYMNNSDYLINTHFYINQNYLDALNLEAPKTVEELTDVLRAFKTQDPNGNGEADEIPMTTGIYKGASGIAYFLQLFGLPLHESTWLYIDDNKQVHLSAYEDGFRECMEWMHQCYEEGLLDVEVLSQDIKTVGTKTTSGLAGFCVLYRNMDTFADAETEPYSLWVPDDENVVFHRKLNLAKAGAYITVANEYPEATMRLFEAMLDKETQWTMYAGEAERAEGGWKYNKDGLIESYVNEGVEAPTTAAALGVCSLFFAPGEFYGKSYASADSRYIKLDHVQQLLDNCNVQKYSYGYFNLVEFTTEQNEQRALTETEINSAVKEYMAIFIRDGVTDTSWNEFQQVLKNMKADEYIQMYQEGIDKIDLQ